MSLRNALSRGRVLLGLRVLNTIVLSVAIAYVLADHVLPAQAIQPQFRHWAKRDVVVADRTGDDGWRAAFRHAAAVWDQRASGVDLRVRWTAGGGPCVPHPGEISLCETTHDDLNRDTLFPLEGITTEQKAADGHGRSAVIEVCSDCELDGGRQAVVAAHELGHALGFSHSEREESVMYRGGGPPAPDPADYAELRRLYGHRDKVSDRDGCLLHGWLRVGPICL